MPDTPIELPMLGESVTEGTILKWLKKIGDSVDLDEPIYEISTDKVDTEVPSPAAGVLKEIKVAEGDTAEVGTVLAILESAEAAVVEESEAAAEAGPEQVAAAETGTEEEGGAEESREAIENTAVIENAAAENGGEPTESGAPSAPEKEPSAPENKPAESTAAGESETEPAPSESAAEPAKPAKRITSPLVRRLMRDYGLDKSSVTATGRGGRITRKDVEAALTANLRNAGNSGAQAKESSPPQFRNYPPTDTSIPLSKIRKLTAEHMLRSKDTSPHVLTAVEVDFENLERVRQELRPSFKAEEGISLTYLPFVIRAVCDALSTYPHINASISEEELTVHNYVNMGIAVDLNFEGLLAPVIKDADTKPLRDLAVEIVDLATRARTKKLLPDDLSGGTFTITNPGQYGTLMQFPIINQPQVAILSTDGVSRKPVVTTNADGEESIAIHSVGVLALAWDHRAFDGAYVAAFLDHLRKIIEDRDWSQEF